MAKDKKSDNTNYQEKTEAAGKLKWTVMIYLAGDNNLSPQSISIMQELEAASHRDDVRVLACFDSNTPRPKGARYLEINHRRGLPPLPKPINWGLHNDLVPPEELDVCPISAPDFCNDNPTTVINPIEPTAALGLSRFIKYAKDHHPADRYMLVLFGHGTAVAGNTFLADDNPPSFLRLQDFSKVLKEHFSKDKLDILACDNCVMNGIETAYELRNEVDIMLGSQGLMLAVGWPYRRIINVVEKWRSERSEVIARKIIRACARRLLDYSLMDRSTEQSVCDLRLLRDPKNLVSSIKKLATALKVGLKTDKKTGELLYPAICDAIRLSRLEAQSYWDETFVDLYDFCELLLEKCDIIYRQTFSLFYPLTLELAQKSTLKAKANKKGAAGESDSNFNLRNWMLEREPMQSFQTIGLRCKEVIREIKKFVDASYYVGADLQYSHGVSIYFPWTLPKDPIIFEPVPPRPGSPPGEPNEFELKTAFDEYKDYAFAQTGAGDWADVLDKYFRATLRNVRRFEKVYKESTDEGSLFDFIPDDKRGTLPIDLQKSTSDTDKETDCTCPTIKNYPRRFYLSPADCKRNDKRALKDDSGLPDNDKDHVSYLGWHIRGVVAEVIGLPAQTDDLESPDEADDSYETESGG